MTKVTSKICERYAAYYTTLTKLNRNSKYEQETEKLWEDLENV